MWTIASRGHGSVVDLVVEYAAEWFIYLSTKAQNTSEKTGLRLLSLSRPYDANGVSSVFHSVKNKNKECILQDLTEIPSVNPSAQD